MKGILFKPVSEEAIRAGRKWMTRRIIKPQPPAFVDYFDRNTAFERYRGYMSPGEPTDYWLPYPRYRVTEIVYVKRTFFSKQADSSLRLRILTARPERLQEITPDDCIAEGIPFGGWPDPEPSDALGNFVDTWDSINGKTHPWDSNPWVWVYGFEIVGG